VTPPQPDTPAAPPQAASGSDSRPEPVRNAAAIASAVTGITGLALTILVLTHVLTPEGSAVLGPALASAIPTVLGAVGSIAAALHSRTKVTPLSDPRNALGHALVSVDLVRAAEGLRRLPSQGTPGPDHSAG
jgi:hypothetical protein